MHFSFDNDHQARIGRILPGDVIPVVIVGDGIIPAPVDDFLDLILRQTPEQRTFR